MLADNGISFKGTSHFSQASGESKFSKIHLQKNEDLKRNVNKYYFAFFPGHLNNWCRALFKNVTFSRQKKYRRYFIIASQ